MTAIKFDRTPYQVTYYDANGEKKVIRRQPPPKVHNILPEDKVELRFKKNDDWREGDEVSVQAINPRQPNTLQVVKPDGERTFVSALDVTLKEKLGVAEGEDVRDLPRNNRYLRWP